MLRNDNPARRRLLPGDATKYIRHVDELPAGRPAVLWCRVSTHAQRHKQNLDDSGRDMRQELAARGNPVVAVVRYVGSGWEVSCEFLKAVRLARQHGAVIVAETVDRLVRHPVYHSELHPRLQARESDLQELHYWADGVPMYTMLSPAAGWREARGYQSARGQRVKERKGGRKPKTQPGAKKQRRLKLLPRVIEMHAAGSSGRTIAKTLDVAESVVRDWLKKYADRGAQFLPQAGTPDVAITGQNTGQNRRGLR